MAKWLRYNSRNKQTLTRIFFIGELVILRIILRYSGIFTPDKFLWRMLTYILLLGLIIIIIFVTGIDKNKLGLSLRKQQMSAYLEILVVTVIGASALISLHYFAPAMFAHGLYYSSKTSIILKIIIYSFISVPVQELIFRGYYISRLELLTTSRFFIVLFSALIFGLIHIPFGLPLITMGTFLLGIIYARNFLHYRNLYPLMLGHCVLGGILVYFINI